MKFFIFTIGQNRIRQDLFLMGGLGVLWHGWFVY